MTNKSDSADKAILMAAFAKMDPVALAVALGTVWALILMVATYALLIKGAPPDPEWEIGGHLGLLGIYLPGYQVSWFGGLLGGFYMWLIGGVVGYILAILWNLTHYLYIVMIVVRSAWWRMMAE